MTAENDTKMDGKSLDITKENIAALKELFPEIVEEGKIDFDKLKVILGEEVDDDNERYNFTWHGKNQAIRMSQTPSMGTLSPCKEESVDWDTTQNLYIEGDNLEVLKLLQKSYFGKVKMIYIDPPYNTGKDFVYPDNFSDNITNYKQITNQTDNTGNNVSTNSETAGKYHTNWLNMIYPRLKLARNFLSDDGAIVISIDDNEVDNLKKICSEIFGEDNFIGELPTIMNLKGNNDEFCFAGTHEYTLFFCKNKDLFKPCQLKVIEEIQDWDEDEYGLFKKGANLKSTGTNAPRSKRPNLYYPIFVHDGVVYVTENDKPRVESDVALYPITDGSEMSWRWEKRKVASEPYNILLFGTDGQYSIYKKQRPELGDIPSKKPKSLLYKPEYSSGNGTSEIKSLFDGIRIFSHPKPCTLIRDLIEIVSGNDKEAIIMDFFSGSSTTAHSTMLINSEDQGTRKCISIQLPEPLMEKEGNLESESIQQAISFLDKINKAHNICEIGKERIRRAGKEIKRIQLQTRLDGQKNGVDVGFRVFKLDSSNVKLWNPSGDVKQTLLNYENNIISDSGRTNLDIVYEIMLKIGLGLTSKIETIIESNSTLYSISSGALMVCLDDIKDTSVAEKMISIYKEQKPFVWKVVFKDNGFASDDVKANTRETLKMAGLPEGSFVTL